MSSMDIQCLWRHLCSDVSNAQAPAFSGWGHGPGGCESMDGLWIFWYRWTDVFTKMESANQWIGVLVSLVRDILKKSTGSFQFLPTNYGGCRGTFPSTSSGTNLTWWMMDLGRYLILSHAQKEDTAGSTSPGFHIFSQVSGAQRPLSKAQPRRLGRPSTSPGARCCRAMAFMAGCCSSSWEFKHGWWLDSDRQNLWAPAKLGFDILALLCEFNWFYGNRFDPTRMEITNK